MRLREGSEDIEKAMVKCDLEEEGKAARVEKGEKGRREKLRTKFV